MTTPPILNDDGELTPWAEAVAGQYAQAVVAGDAVGQKRVTAMLSTPEARPLRELCDDMRTSRALAETFGGRR